LAEDLTLNDLVSAFRLELKDGLAKLDTLGQTLQNFEARAKDGFRDVGDKADEQTKRIASAFSQGLQAALGHVGRFVVGLIGVGGLLEAVRRVGAAFTSSNKEQEEFTNRLQGVVGSAGAAAAELRRLEEFGAKTGANVGQLVDAYIELRQRGISPTNEALKGLGNAAVATNTDIASVAQMMMYAVQDAGKGLKQFGIEMTQAGAKTTFVWANAAGELKRTITESTDAAISATLLAIWNEKYAGRMDEFATTWSGMWGRLKNEASQALTMVGQAGAWTEIKAQLAAFMGQLQSLKGIDLATWAKSTSDAITPLVKLFGSLGRAILEVPLAAEAAGDFVGRTFANIITAAEKGILFVLNMTKTATSLIPGVKSHTEALDRAIDTMKGAIADTTFASTDLDRQMHDNLRTMVGMEQAGAKAADAVRQVAAVSRDAGAALDPMTTAIRAANAAWDQERTTLLDLYGVYDRARLQDKMAEIVDQAYKLHEHGVPANEILAALGPNIKKVADTYDADFQDKFTLPADFDRLKTAAGEGKLSMEDFLAYLDNEAWKKLKTGAQASVIEVEKAGGGIAAALRGGFGQGIDDSLVMANKKIDSWITVQATKKITIAVDISDMDLATKLQRLGYTPKSTPNTAGINR